MIDFFLGGGGDFKLKEGYKELLPEENSFKIILHILWFSTEEQKPVRIIFLIFLFVCFIDFFKLFFFFFFFF